MELNSSNSHIYSISSKSPHYKPSSQRPAQPQQSPVLHNGIKLIDSPDSEPNETTTMDNTHNQFQRKLFKFIYIYAMIMISLYIGYTTCDFFHQRKISAHIIDSAGEHEQRHDRLRAIREENEYAAGSSNLLGDLETKFESKIHLLERYLEVIALDLQETKSKLREREKCDCSISCIFNGTKYADQSSWNNQCDICTCQAGKISCAPQKCPALKCDDAIILPGQCCPTCMRKCKYNNSFIRHGDKFRPIELSPSKSQAKECTCHDGKIKCEPTTGAKSKQAVVGVRPKTTIINSIAGDRNKTSTNKPIPIAKFNAESH